MPEQKKSMSAHDQGEKKLSAEVDRSMRCASINADKSITTKVIGSKSERKSHRNASDTLNVMQQVTEDKDYSAMPTAAGTYLRKDDTAVLESAGYSRKKESEQIKKDIVRSRRAVKVMTGEEATKHHIEAGVRDFMTPLERQRQRFVKRKRAFGDRENETLSKLSAFSNSLKMQKSTTGGEDQPGNIFQGHNENYRGQVLERDDSGDDDINEGWHLGKLKFRKHVDDKYRTGDHSALNDYKVIDARHDSNSRGFSAKS